MKYRNLVVMCSVVALGACDGSRAATIPPSRNPPAPTLLTEAAATLTRQPDSPAQFTPPSDTSAAITAAPDAPSVSVPVLAVSLTPAATCVLTKSSAVACWGVDAVVKTPLTPAEVTRPHLNLASHAVMLAGSSETSCVVLRDARTTCWLYRGAASPLPEPAEAPWGNAAGARKNATIAKTVAVSPGGYFDCVLASTGAVRCWGATFYFPVPAAARFTPKLSKPVHLAGQATIVSAGESHVCAALERGGMQCWGTGTDGKLGYGDNKWRAQPPTSPVLLANHRVVSVAAGYESTCAVLSDGTARCWGRAQDGRCYGCEADGSAPPGSLTSADSTFVISFERPIRDIALGRDAACVILEGGELRCWHSEDDGTAILGTGIPRRTTPINSYGEVVRIEPSSAVTIDLGGPVAQVRIGITHNVICAVREDGALFCWGKNNPPGILGYDRSDDIGDDEKPLSAGPVPIRLPAVPENPHESTR